MTLLVSEPTGNQKPTSETYDVSRESFSENTSYLISPTTSEFIEVCYITSCVCVDLDYCDRLWKEK